MSSIFGGGEIPVLLAAVGARVTALSWRDLILHVAPGLLALALIVVAMVKFYGDSRVKHLTELFDQKLNTVSLEMQRYNDRERDIWVTESEFSERMRVRDLLVSELAKKQDNLREEKLPSLRVEVSRLQSMCSPKVEAKQP